MINILKLRKLEKEKSGKPNKAGTKPDSSDSDVVSLDEGKVVEGNKKVSKTEKKTPVKKTPAKKNGVSKATPKKKTGKASTEKIKVEPPIEEIRTEETENFNTFTEPETAAAEALRQKLMDELMAQDDIPAQEIAEWPSDILTGGKEKESPEIVEVKAEKIPEEIKEPPVIENELPKLIAEDKKKTEAVSNTTASKPAETKSAKVEQATVTAKKIADAETNKVHEDTIQLIGFGLGEEVFGFDINSIREINRISVITEVPNVPDYVEGVMNLRGNVIPIINLRVKIKMKRKEYDSNTRIIIIEGENMVVGFIVDEVKEVLRIPGSIIQPPPAIAVSKASEYIKSVARTDAGLIILLETEKLLSRDDFKG